MRGRVTTFNEYTHFDFLELGGRTMRRVLPKMKKSPDSASERYSSSLSGTCKKAQI